MEIIAVPGRAAGRDIADRVLDRFIDFATYGVGFADHVAAAALGRVLGIGDAGADGDAELLGAEGGALDMRHRSSVAAARRDDRRHENGENKQPGGRAKVARKHCQNQINPNRDFRTIPKAVRG